MGVFSSRQLRETAIGLEKSGFCERAELEERVIELMNSKKGEAVRERVLKLREDAVEAKSDGGSSCIAMAKVGGFF
ncbi:hypothetical protein D5086_027906 [Populus alba]|uniref:Uncharacterized protein n=1 Tax=Populus alba TaxID=43335 RepID=A0ACC4AWN3_POPAL